MFLRVPLIRVLDFGRIGAAGGRNDAVEAEVEGHLAVVVGGVPDDGGGEAESRVKRMRGLERPEDQLLEWLPSRVFIVRWRNSRVWANREANDSRLVTRKAAKTRAVLPPFYVEERVQKRAARNEMTHAGRWS